MYYFHFFHKYDEYNRLNCFCLRSNHTNKATIILTLIYQKIYNYLKNPNFHNNFHQIEHVFVCEILNDSQLGNGHETDKKQIGYRWIKLNKLTEYKVLPSPIKSLLQTDDLTMSNSYLGDVN